MYTTVMHIIYLIEKKSPHMLKIKKQNNERLKQ
jgi:hypothetical protein